MPVRGGDVHKRVPVLGARGEGRLVLVQQHVHDVGVAALRRKVHGAAVVLHGERGEHAVGVLIYFKT